MSDTDLHRSPSLHRSPHQNIDPYCNVKICRVLPQLTTQGLVSSRTVYTPSESGLPMGPKAKYTADPRRDSTEKGRQAFRRARWEDDDWARKELEENSVTPEIELAM